jgi:hypothetical protein
MDKHDIAAYLQYIGATMPAVGHGWRKMRCPFHGDKHASAAVNYEENKFKCFGCEVSGDIYDLIMYKQGGNYREAVQFAEGITPTGNGGIRQTYSHGSRVSSKPTSIGRRSTQVSSRDSEGRSSRARTI